MSTNKIDKEIAEKLKDRTFKPSASAWERLSSQLDEQETKKKRNWFLYVGYAAGIALLFSVGISFFGEDSEIVPTKEIIVNAPIDTLQFDDSKLKELVPVEEAIVESKNGDKRTKNQDTRQEEINNKKSIVIVNKMKQSLNNNKTVVAKNDKPIIKKSIVIPTKENTSKLKGVVIAKVDKTEKQNNALEKASNSRIKVNSEDLLYSVTHSPTEVKAYYAKYNVDREDVLKTIKYELKKSNLKVNPNTILAEVERGIDDDLFQNNFMQKLKLKISDIAVAIADRNK